MLEISVSSLDEYEEVEAERGSQKICPLYRRGSPHQSLEKKENICEYFEMTIVSLSKNEIHNYYQYK